MTTNEVLTNITNKVEEECGIKNASFLVSLILLYIDPETWTVDKTYLNRLYQAISIIEKDEELKNFFKNNT